MPRCEARRGNAGPAHAHHDARQRFVDVEYATLASVASGGSLDPHHLIPGPHG
jgi:hypothetical protein